MKFDFSALNFETLDANVNASPDMFVNVNGITFTKRVLEDMNPLLSYNSQDWQGKHSIVGACLFIYLVIDSNDLF